MHSPSLARPTIEPSYGTGKTPHWSTKSGSNEDTGAGSFDYPLEFARHGTAASAHTRRKDDNASGAHSSGTHSSNSHSGFANDEEAASAPIFGPAPRPSGMESKPVEGFLCRVCDEFVTSLSEDKHNTSTLHIFNQQHKPTERKVRKFCCRFLISFRGWVPSGFLVRERFGRQILRRPSHDPLRLPLLRSLHGPLSFITSVGCHQSSAMNPDFWMIGHEIVRWTVCQVLGVYSQGRHSRGDCRDYSHI